MGFTITRKVVGGTGWALATPADMLTALIELEAEGWTGAVSNEGDWSLRLSANSRNTINAKIGQCLALDGDLKLVTPQELTAAYEVDKGVKLPEPEPEPGPELPATADITDAGERDSAVVKARPNG